MYTGPSKSGLFRNPLLPDDFDDSTPKDENDSSTENNQQDTNVKDTQQVEQEYASQNNSTWRSAKTSMSNFATGRSSDFKRTISTYVKAHGGAKTASSTAKSGISTSINFGNFFNNVAKQGFKEALNQAQINYVGKSAKEILTAVINYLAPIPITKEDAIARKAIISTMEILYEKFEEEGKDITSLESLDIDTLNSIVPIQIESYIYERIINDLGSRIEINAPNPSDAINKEQLLKEYIESKVEITLKGVDFSTLDYNNKKNIELIVEGMYNQCYKVMEDML